jgi:hypothetical protein
LKRNVSSLLAGIAAVISLVCAASCSVPLAPGFRIAKETREIHFVAGEPPTVAIHEDLTLVNSGNSSLNFIDVRLPSEKSTGRGDLHVKVDGREVFPVQLPAAEQEAEPDVVRIALEAPWNRKKKRELSFDYTLRSPADSRMDITVEPASFHLGVRGWAPQLQPPKHFLAPSPSLPERMSYRIQVPADFAILAGGARKGQKNYGQEIEYRFQLGREDLGAFVVAGHYERWPSKNERDSVQFWTTQSLNKNPEKAEQQIAVVWKTLTNDFGVFDKRIHAPIVVESAAVRDRIGGNGGPAAESFPGGALVNPAAFALGVDSDRLVQIVSEALARNWFDEEVEPSEEAALGMGEGLPEYASIVTDEARNGPLARRQRIYEYLRRYDAAVKYAAETPLAATTMDSPLPQRRIALAKAPLFYIELEDACGEAPVRAGLAHMLTSLRGQEVDYKVLRSALEESTGRELGKLFREWLNQKGIPKNFRARYRYGEGSQEMGN